MLRLYRLWLRNYRSIGICNPSLEPLTLLVGSNGSGKSNVFDALRFTSWVLDESLNDAFRECGGIAEMRRRSAGHPIHSTIVMTFVMDAERQAGEYEFEIGAVRDGEYRVSRKMCRTRSGEPGSEDWLFEMHIGQLMSSSEERPPRIFPDRLLLVVLSGQEPLRQLFDGLASAGVLSSTPEAIRVVQKPDLGNLLRQDASNIALVIERLRHTDLPAKARTEEYLSHIVPGMKAIQHVDVASWEALEFQQEVQGAADPWSFQASSMNDGTLRALGVSVTLFTGTGGMMNPVRTEKPESTLHPATSGLLLDAIRDASQRKQIPATSHSPDLLDSPSITVDELLAVRSVLRTTAADRPDATARVALKEPLFTAGELVRADQLQPGIGGVAQ